MGQSINVGGDSGADHTELMMKPGIIMKCGHSFDKPHDLNAAATVTSKETWRGIHSLRH